MPKQFNINIVFNSVILLLQDIKMAFHDPLPCIKEKKKDQAHLFQETDDLGLPDFRKEQFSEIELIGIGSFGKAFKVQRDRETFVMKELECQGHRELRVFMKEVKLLKTLRHENIVRICEYSDDSAMLLEIASFDFRRMGINQR